MNMNTGPVDYCDIVSSSDYFEWLNYLEWTMNNEPGENEVIQTYFGEPDDYPVFVPIQLFDENGYEIIEPIAYNGNEPIW